MSTRTNFQHIGIGKVLETMTLEVPVNQRSYSWTDREIDDLWSDLKWAISAGEKEYFLGTIVLTVKENSRPLVVDGQQRLASVSMIYAGMRDYLLGIGEEPIAQDVEQFLTNTDRWTQTKSPKLTLSLQDDHFFQKHVLCRPDSVERTQAAITKTSPDSHKRIAKAFKKIRESLTEHIKGAPEPLKILKQWDKFLQESARLIVFEVDDESSAFQVFETLNDRGLDLAVTDLLKNYLLGKAGKQQLETARHHWTTALSRIGDGDERIFKRFIHHFWSSIHGLTRERLLYKSIKETIKTPNRAMAFASELSASAGNYAAILNSDSDVWVPMGTAGRRAISILRDLKLEQYKPLLLACMDTMNLDRPAEVSKLLDALVSWSVRFRVTQQLGSSKLEDFYGNGGKLVRDNKLRTAKEIIGALRGKVPSDAAFRSAFEDCREESARIARYYLLEIERVLRTKQKNAQLVDPDERVNNLEHILPKEPDLNIWKEFTEESAHVYLYRLGNQTVLSKAENAKLGNAHFQGKRAVFLASDIQITKAAGAFKAWNEGHIESRQEWMAELAVLAWPIGG